MKSKCLVIVILLSLPYGHTAVERKTQEESNNSFVLDPLFLFRFCSSKSFVFVILHSMPYRLTAGKEGNTDNFSILELFFSFVAFAIFIVEHRFKIFVGFLLGFLLFILFFGSPSD